MPMRPTRSRSARRALLAAAMAVTALVVAPPASADAPAGDPEVAAYEVEFLTMMIDHHQMAVHMSELCLERAVHDKLSRLCERIMETQAEEIALMQSWLLDWYGIEHEPAMDDPAHHEQMMMLQELSGEAFEAAFLAMMISHHAMAVEDGSECVATAEHRELRTLCRRIVASQQREIMQMRMWLCRWYGECDAAYRRSA
jgi:uncharacterized protein (DUF305 family)